MKKIKVAVNGVGRIGRSFIKLAYDNPQIDIVAVNDLADINNIGYLLKYDTVYGKFDKDIKVEEGIPGKLKIGDREIIYLSEKDPTMLPWKNLDIDVVVESTGLFVSYEKSKTHLSAGAKKVIVTAPVKDEAPTDIKGLTALVGINEDLIREAQISSNASCTTNAASPLIAILDEAIGIEKAILNTVHAYTASQSIVDGPNKKDWREGRAGAQNMIPSTTGAAIATTKVITGLAGKFDGISIRVPVVAGSIVDVTFIAKRNTTKEEVNEILKNAALSERWQGIFGVTEEELVSRDILGMSFASLADLAFTRVVDGNLVKVLGWYDNEMGYTHTLLRHVLKAGESL